MKKKYSISGIDCANCAAKLESKMNEIHEVDQVVLTFATGQLLVEAEDIESVLPKLQELAEKIEPGTVIDELKRNRKKAVSHGEQCGCGEHEHHHEHGEHFGCEEHEHGAHCECGEHEQHNEKEKQLEEEEKEKNDTRKEMMTLGIGVIFFGAGIAASHLVPSLPVVSILLFVISYLILGGEVLLTALQNMCKGKVFDENFLMSIATIGAFAIGEYPEAVGVMLFYRIGELFEDIAVNKSRKQIMDAVDMRPDVVRVVTGDQIQQRDPEEVQIGEIVEVRPGDRIPLDGIVTRGESRIDTSAVTGEPVPVAVEIGDEVISGCVNGDSVLYIQVQKLLEESMVTRILEAVENAAASKPKIDRFITKFARIYTPFVVVLAIATAVIPSLITGNWMHWIYTALTFLVISCPCALVLSVPLAFFAGIGAGSKKGILFKGGVSLEMMSQVKAVVMDKTGTITKGNFQVAAIQVADASWTEQEILAMAASAESRSTHPIAASIVAAAREQGIQVAQAHKITEISGKGIVVENPDGQILCGNQKLFEMHQVKISAEDTQDYGTEVILAKNGTYIGRILIHDMIKADSADAIGTMKKKGLWTAMLTGDATDNAQMVGKETGIDEVYARQMPEEKLQNLQKIRQERGAVMFIGDGINDAPVLAGADVGAAMGSGADAAIEAADVVFMNSRLGAVNECFDIARMTQRIAMENVIGALAIKAMVMVLGLAGVASMWMAVFADSGVAMLCVMNAVRILFIKEHR